MNHTEIINSLLKMFDVSRWCYPRGEYGELMVPDADYLKCSRCGLRIRHIRSYEGARCVVRSQRCWPFLDHLGRFEAVWSARMVEHLSRLGFSGFRAHRVPVTEQGTRKELDGIPDYYAIEVTGRINLDRSLFDGEEGVLCSECGHLDIPSREGSKYWAGDVCAVVDKENDLPDLALVGNIMHGGLYCRPRFVDLVRDQGFTGFRVQPSVMGMPFNIERSDWLDRYREVLERRFPFDCVAKVPIWSRFRLCLPP